MPNPMDYNVAYRQAEEMLTPQYERQMDNLRNQQIQRGFYGQMPGDVMQQQLASQQVAQTGQMATDLQHQDWQRQMQQQEFDFMQQQYEDEQDRQFWSTIGGIAGAGIGAFVGNPYAGYAIGSSAGSTIGS